MPSTQVSISGRVGDGNDVQRGCADEQRGSSGEQGSAEWGSEESEVVGDF